MGWLSSAIAAVAKAVSTAVSAVKDVATAIVSSVAKTVTSAVSSVKSVVSNVVSSAASKASTAATAVKSAVTTAATAVKETTATAAAATITATAAAVKEKIIEAPPVVEKKDSPFVASFKRLVDFIKAGKVMEASKESVTLMGASVFPEDIEVVAGFVPIAASPAGISPAIAAKLGAKLTIWGNISQVLKNLVMAAKANPLITIFAATEIPQITIMSVFAFKWLAEQKGEGLSSVSISLGALYKSWESGGYEFRDAVKDGSYGSAAKVLASMVQTTEEYSGVMKEKKDVLQKAGEYEARAAILDLMKTANEKMKAEIEPQIRMIQSELAESMNVRVREIVDGDSIRVRWDDGDITLDVRLVGINAPETGEPGKKESKEWLSKEIWGADVVMLVDPARKRDQYDRVLGVITKAGEDINLKSVYYGWSFAYIREPNKFVNAEEYLKAEATAKRLNRGVWAMLVRVGSIGVSSSPTHAQIFLDGIDTGVRTAETLKDVAVGKHTIKLTLEGYEDYEESVDVEEDRKKEIFKKLEKKIEAVPEVEKEIPAEEVAEPEVMPTLKEFYIFLGTYVEEGKRLTRKEWEAIGKKYQLSQLGKAPVKAVSVQDLFLIAGDYVVGKAVLTLKEWEEIGKVQELV